MSAEEYRKLLLNLMGSLTLCDHMGDVLNAISFVMPELGMDRKWWEVEEAKQILHDNGATALRGSPLV